MFVSLIYAYGVFWLAAISPGPDFAVTVKNSVLHGRKAGLLCALGVALANGFHILYISAGVGALLSNYPEVYKGLQIAAAFYLAYLGLSAIRSSLKNKTSADQITKNESQKPVSTLMPFREGLFVNLVNPKAIIFWISYFSLVINQNLPKYVHVLFTSLLVVSLLFWFSIVALSLSEEKVRLAFLKRENAFNILMGSLLILLGLKVLF